MADYDDIAPVNEEENELDRVLMENGHDPKEFDLAEKRELVTDISGETDHGSTVVNDDVDSANDGLPGSVPPDEQDGTR